MLTAQQNNTANGAAFEGNIVVFENRPFSLDRPRWREHRLPGRRRDRGRSCVRAQHQRRAVRGQGQPGYGAGADRTVLLRWPATQPDPVVKVGDFIADVTYERSQNLVYSRFYFTIPPTPATRPRRPAEPAEQ